MGMAIAGKWLAAHFNQPGFEIFDYNVYALCGDGDMMEGVASEAASLAGHLKLSNLCWIYDENHVTLDGLANVSFTEDVGKRFEAYGWNVEHVTDANDLQMLADAYNGFLKTKDRPTLIRVNSHIGYGSPHKQDTSAAHGEPLGEEEVRLVKKFYGWPEEAKFLVPEGVLDNFKNGIGKRGGICARSGRRCSRTTERNIPTWPTRSSACKSASCPTDGTRTCQHFPPTRKALPRARVQERS